MIPKGCTCKNTFPFPYAKEEVATIYITYQQDGETIIEKDIDNCEFAEGKVSVKLTQEESLKFNDDTIVKVQIRCRLNNGAVIKSNIMKSHTDEILKSGVI